MPRLQTCELGYGTRIVLDPYTTGFWRCSAGWAQHMDERARKLYSHGRTLAAMVPEGWTLRFPARVIGPDTFACADCGWAQPVVLVITDSGRLFRLHRLATWDVA